mmetsp:Transcript_44125/g.112408  ORF Transcript_44125/g.112408 Transcript_44125/m.112408 type:complete len:251 (-) Transcript_44125:144-896(-)
MKHSPPRVPAMPSRSEVTRASQLLPPRSSLPSTNLVVKTKLGRRFSAWRTSWALGTSVLQSSLRKRHVIQRTRSCPSLPVIRLSPRCQSSPDTTRASNVHGCRSSLPCRSTAGSFCSSFLSISAMTLRRLWILPSTLSEIRSSTSSAGRKSTATVIVEPPPKPELSGGETNLKSTPPSRSPCNFASASPPRIVPANSARQSASRVAATRETSRTSCFVSRLCCCCCCCCWSSDTSLWASLLAPGKTPFFR